MKKVYLFLIAIITVAAMLRLYRLDKNPPSLYWDEASLGYNAFAILTTGHDEHGELLPITRFIAFGDYKPPGYIYAAVPSLALFGVNEFAIRFPSALAGILMVGLTYWLVVLLTRDSRIGIVSAALLAISAWSLQLSRAAFEAHLAAFFNLLGVLLILLSLRRPQLLPISILAFVASFYTFNANRIIAPVLLLFLFLIYAKELIVHKKWLIVAVIVGLVTLWPNVSYFQTRESRLRFQEVTIFNELDIIKKSNERISRHHNAWWARVIHNRRVYFAQEFLKHYVDHFRGDYLFITGDFNPRLSIQSVGELYFFELPFLLAGLYLYLTKRSRASSVLFGWMLIAPLPAAMARETPHMLRTASLLPTLQIITGSGMVFVWDWLKKKNSLVTKVTVSLFTILASLNFYYYFHHYWVHYAVRWSSAWQYGYKQMVEKVRQLEPEYDGIVVTSHLGRPYIYFLLYGQVYPGEYLANRRADRDWYGFWTVYGFDKYDFTDNPPEEGERVLKVGTASSIDPPQKLDEIRAPDGEVIFEIGE